MGFERREPGFKFYLALFLAMMIVHQDFWLWNSTTLVLGVLPIGLAYQMGYSLLAAVVMAALVRRAWPAQLERLERGEEPRR